MIVCALIRPTKNQTGATLKIHRVISSIVRTTCTPMRWRWRKADPYQTEITTHPARRRCL